MTSLCLFLLSVALPINFLNMFFAVASSSVRLTVVVACRSNCLGALRTDFYHTIELQYSPFEQILSQSIWKIMIICDYNIILRKLTLLSYVHFCNVDFTIKEILKDPDEVQQLMHNLSIPPSISEGLLNTTVNTKEVKRRKNCTGVLSTLWTVLLALIIIRGC